MTDRLAGRALRRQWLVSTDRFGHEQVGWMTFWQRLGYFLSNGRWPWKPPAGYSWSEAPKGGD